jgi:starch synthase
MPPERPLRVCVVSAEVAPFAKTGGLADVSAALARFLARRRHDVRVVLPMYASIRQAYEARPVAELQDVELEIGGRKRFFSVSTLALPKSTATVYAIRCPELYERGGIYTQDRDEHVRFAFLGLAALRICQHLGWSPDVLHCNDWHTALLPLYLWTHLAWDELFAKTRAVLTIHNIGYQGVFAADVVGELGLENERGMLHQEDLADGKVNFLKTGLLYANAITTVSETYAREIQTPELGMGLDGILRQRSSVLRGIVNGVDYGEWNPRTDALLPARYSPKDLSGKRECRRTLLERMNLKPDASAPVVGIVSRLTSQKGLDLLYDVLPRLLAEREMRVCVLGRGERDLESFFGDLPRRFPGKAAYDTGYKEELAHHIEAGSDLFLMPSRYEPCGLNQMYSLKYGTPPVVRRTGGLADTVEPWDPRTRQGTGFLFGDFKPSALYDTLRFALHCYQDEEAWRSLMQNGMARDFSWDRQGEHYVDLYRQLATS